VNADQIEARLEGQSAEPGMVGSHQVVLILDFGSQYTQLIARRVRESHVYCEVLPYTCTAEEIARRRPLGLILSGGPQSVYERGAVRMDPQVFGLGIPILGICYGFQLITQQLGGGVESSGRREYGRAEIELSSSSLLFEGLGRRELVWMSHGDRVERPPSGFHASASTTNAPIVALEDPERRIYGIQFHPEVSHTVSGERILRNFLYRICGADGDWAMASFVDEAVTAIRSQAPEGRVLCALSGGVDSSVVAALLTRAVGERLTAVFVDNGLLRKGERWEVEKSLASALGLPLVVADAASRFLGELDGITDPEEKRRTVGRVFIEVFEEEAARLGDVRYLAQGTLYPDVIESVSVRGPSAVIKTHHNVGGLPEKLGFELVEPLRMLFKDETRQLGRELGLPEEFIVRHPFPGPGLAVRILGAVTPDRVETLREADAIFLEELRSHDLYRRVSQAFAVLLPVHTVGVMGDSRTYENVVALRAVETQDFMTADWSFLPHDLLARVANRIVNEIRGVNRVVYDVTSKPPATIEWE
jgi:GMP synthase (glutamine-hydrolysing)